MNIMIVEDNANLRKSMKEFIASKFPRVTFTEAGDGKEAMERIDAQSPDLIFMDIHLPDGNGLELTRKIRTRYPGVAVVVVTADDLPEYREAAHRFGAKGFLSKDSMDWREISALITALLSERNPREGKA